MNQWANGFLCLFLWEKCILITGYYSLGQLHLHEKLLFLIHTWYRLQSVTVSGLCCQTNGTYLSWIAMVCSQIWTVFYVCSCHSCLTTFPRQTHGFQQLKLQSGGMAIGCGHMCCWHDQTKTLFQLYWMDTMTLPCLIFETIVAGQAALMERELFFLVSFFVCRFE